MPVLPAYQKIIQETIEKYEEETNELIDKCFETALDEACNIEDYEQSIKNEESKRKLHVNDIKNEKERKEQEEQKEILKKVLSQQTPPRRPKNRREQVVDEHIQAQVISK